MGRACEAVWDMSEIEYMWVVGVVDHTGAIHYRKVTADESHGDTHSKFWPNITHKRWRFLIREWDLKKSMMEQGPSALTLEDYDRILTLMRKILPPPLWVLEGDAWEAAGRPRDEAYDEFLKQWEKKKKAILKKRGK